MAQANDAHTLRHAYHCTSVAEEGVVALQEDIPCVRLQQIVMLNANREMQSPAMKYMVGDIQRT